MATMKKLAQGAEAVIHTDQATVIKYRTTKKYRHKKIDDALRQFRTRREAKILQKLEKLKFPAPRLFHVDDEKKEIHMQHILGKKVKDVLHEDHILYAREIGKKIAELHANDIIHGDLTTSNMIQEQEIYFIDFGLGQFSAKPEDKAVDLWLLRRALESKHHKIFEECFHEVMESYQKHYAGSKEVLDRLKAVERRGRHRQKKGS
ncbi:Kae1-associated serine/threonine protein kinase [Candidatus Woesearchaeota archaeon]|nr:Kae1-associated serine/threonine protein kinase [Candidatus Woesearchaeota archaeon]